MEEGKLLAGTEARHRRTHNGRVARDRSNAWISCSPPIPQNLIAGILGLGDRHGLWLSRITTAGFQERRLVSYHLQADHPRAEPVERSSSNQ